MTAEEAVQKIDEVLSSDLHYDETLGYHLTSDDFEWLKKAKQALEKQIPKTPVKTRKEYIRYTSAYSCPCCGRGFSGTGIADCCYHCGQALRWGDENERKTY